VLKRTDGTREQTVIENMTCKVTERSGRKLLGEKKLRNMSWKLIFLECCTHNVKLGDIIQNIPQLQDKFQAKIQALHVNTRETVLVPAACTSLQPST